MRRAYSVAAAVAAVMACQVAPAAAAWSYDAARRMASVESGGLQLVASCRSDGEIVIFYAVPKARLAEPLVGRERAHFILVVDQKKDGTGRYFSVDSNFIARGDSLAIGFAGPNGLDHAKKFARASRNIIAGISVKSPSAASYTKYNTTEFEIAGSGDAINALLSNCGLK